MRVIVTSIRIHDVSVIVLTGKNMSKSIRYLILKGRIFHMNDGLHFFFWWGQWSSLKSTTAFVAIDHRRRFDCNRKSEEK